jgi:hypothetical protein
MRSCYHKECDSGSNPNLRKREGLKFLAKTTQAIVLSVAELSGGIKSCDLSKIYENYPLAEKNDFSNDNIFNSGIEQLTMDESIGLMSTNEKNSERVDQHEIKEKSEFKNNIAKELLQQLLNDYLKKIPRSMWSKKNTEAESLNFERPIKSIVPSTAVADQLAQVFFYPIPNTILHTGYKWSIFFKHFYLCLYSVYDFDNLPKYCWVRLGWVGLGRDRIARVIIYTHTIYIQHDVFF